MILNRENVDIKTIGDIKFNSVEIDKNSGAKIIAMLTHNLYSNPLQSFIRETVSNAVDSTKEAGNDNPVVVSLTTVNNDTRITVRDFGTGLSPERFDQVFRFLGGSTKENSNDYIGCFGIGRFSCLAVANEAEITSFYDGVCYKYLMYKTSNGINIDLLDTQQTEEKNGLQVSVVIKRSPNCIYAVKNTLAYFDNVVIINDDYIENNVKKGKIGSIKPIELSNGGDFQVVMNGVCYYVDFDKIENVIGVDKTLLIKQTAIDCVVDVKIGDINVTPNREEIMYDDYTCNNIYNRVLEIKKEFLEFKKQEITESGITKDNWRLIPKLNFLGNMYFDYDYFIEFNGELFNQQQVMYIYRFLIKLTIPNDNNNLSICLDNCITSKDIKIEDVLNAFDKGQLFSRPVRLNNHTRDFLYKDYGYGTVLVKDFNLLKQAIETLAIPGNPNVIHTLKKWLLETLKVKELIVPEPEKKVKDKKEKPIGEQVRFKIEKEVHYKKLSELEKDREQYAILSPDEEAKYSHIGKRHAIKVNKTMYDRLLQLGFKTVKSIVDEAKDELYYKKLYCGLEGVNNILKELGYSIDRNAYKRIKQGNCKYHDNYIRWIKVDKEVPEEYKWVENLRKLIEAPIYGYLRSTILKQLLPINFEINDKNEITGQKSESNLFV